MAAAGVWAFIGASSLILGALIALTGRLKGKPLHLLIGFGGGALVSALAYDLFGEAVQASATGLSVAIGFVAGAVTYYIGDKIIERMQGSHTAKGGGGLPLLLGAVLDGIPESIVLGLTLVSGGPSVAILVAIFISNVPESVAGSTTMLESGRRPAWIIGVWTVVAGAGALAAAIGYGLLSTASGDVIALIDAFAAGAILTLLANDLFPAAHAESERLVGLATAAGFAVAAFLSLST